MLYSSSVISSVAAESRTSFLHLLQQLPSQMRKWGRNFCSTAFEWAAAGGGGGGGGKSLLMLELVNRLKRRGSRAYQLVNGGIQAGAAGDRTMQHIWFWYDNPAQSDNLIHAHL